MLLCGGRDLGGRRSGIDMEKGGELVTCGVRAFFVAFTVVVVVVVDLVLQPDSRHSSLPVALSASALHFSPNLHPRLELSILPDRIS